MEPDQKWSVLPIDAEPLARAGLVQAVKCDPRLRICAEVESLGEARELCQQHHPQVIVIDPAQGDGFRFIKDLPQWSEQTRSVVLTRLEDAGSVQRAFQAGALGYVSRRDPTPEVLTAIVAAAVGERHMGPRVQKMLLSGLAHGALLTNRSTLAQLSPRENDVLRLMGAGYSTRAIAEELHLSTKTVETHRQRMREKWGISSGAELARRAVLLAGPAEGVAGSPTDQEHLSR